VKNQALDQFIKALEETQCKKGLSANTSAPLNAENLNLVLLGLGGKPVVINESGPGAEDGSELYRVCLYGLALAARANSEALRKGDD
jgi:hypothetical protein